MRARSAPAFVFAGRQGCVEDEADSALELGVGREVGEFVGEAVDVGEAGLAECAQVAGDAGADGAAGAGAAADGESADFPEGVAADEAEQDALGLDGGAAGESGVGEGVESEFGEAERGGEALGVEDDEREGVGVLVTEQAHAAGERFEPRAGRRAGGGKLDFVEERGGDGAEELVLAGEVGVERHGFDAEGG